ncbi:hypothetical protein NH340_JMT06784 [Sarcoptes scabiei]|nr:hypothetical protein NH340_JMT06784 [Sarcoptes scabiei]
MESKDQRQSWLSLEESIILSDRCADLVINNQFLEAIKYAEEYSEHSLYHSHYYSMLLLFKVYLSLEEPDAKIAQLASEKTMKFCDEIRSLKFRDNFLVKLLIDQNYEQFSEVELHAELIRVEQTIFFTIMEFFLDQSLFTLMKVSYRLRSIFMTYKSFSKLMDNKIWTSSIVGENFRIGVKLGLATYNLMFSMVPQRLMQILSMVGFEGSKYYGLSLLQESSEIKGVRSFVAQILLLVYECYLNQMWNVHSASTMNIRKYIENGLKINSLSLWYSLFKGRCSMIDHNIENAIDVYEGCARIKNLDIKQMTTLYHWELMWSYALKGDWKGAIRNNNELRNICVFSPSTLCYLGATFRIMLLETRLFDESDKNDRCDVDEFDRLSSNQLRKQIEELLKQVPIRVKRYAGRRIPMEKFACEKVDKFLQENRLIAPAYELFIIWNHFIFIEGQKKFLSPIMKHIDRLFQQFTNLDWFNRSLLYLTKGSCLRLLGRYEEAEKILIQIFQNKKFLKNERYLYSFAKLEIGIVSMLMERFEESQQYLIEAKESIRKEDSTELFLHFRIAKAMNLMRRLKCDNHQIDHN